MEINCKIYVEQLAPPGIHRQHSDNRDEQTDKQTYRQKTQRIWPPRRRVKSEPHQTWHGGRGPQARYCTRKTFWGSMHSFATTRC